MRTLHKAAARPNEEPDEAERSVWSRLNVPLTHLRSLQTRTEVQCGVNRGSVCFSHSTSSGTNSATQSPGRHKQRHSCCIFEVQKLAVICLNALTDAWCFLWKTDSNKFRTRIRTDGADGSSFLTELTRGQPYHRLTRTPQTGLLVTSTDRKQKVASKRSNCPEHFEGTAFWAPPHPRGPQTERGWGSAFTERRR